MSPAARALLIILIVGAGLRMFHALEDRELKRDEQYRYLAIAQSLRAGEGFSIGGHPTAQTMPLWPIVAAWAPSPRVLSAALSTLAIGLAWLLARAVFGASATLACSTVAALMALDLDLARLGGTALTESLFTVLLLGTALSWTMRRTVLATVCLAAAVLTRPEALLLPFALALTHRDWRRPAVLLGGVVLALAPWAMRNTRALDSFVPLTTMGGITLHAAWNDVDATLPFRKRGQGRGIDFESALEFARQGEVTPDLAHREQALQSLRDAPGVHAVTLTRKVLLLTTPWQRKGTSVIFALATLLAWIAVWRGRVTSRTARAAAPYLAVAFVVGLAFLAIPRYRAPYHAFLYLLAAQAIAPTRAKPTRALAS